VTGRNIWRNELKGAQQAFVENMKTRTVSAFVLAVMVHVPALAGVVVTQNASPGATSWPGSPMISTVTNPVAQTAVGESFNAVGGCTNYGQTFTIPAANCALQTISIYAGGGTGTAAGTNVTLRLFDLGSQTAPNPSPYTAGADLFNSGNGLAITYSPQSFGVLQFDFTGGDQVTLTNGHMYAFEIDGMLNTSPLLWERTTNDTYSGGAAYRNRTWINGNSARDFAMAVYATSTANTNTNSPWVPIGIVFHAFSDPGNGVNQDGANPAAGLALSGGVLCGTTLNGGSQGAGTVFYMTPDGTNFVAFRSFANAPDAGNPQGELSVSGGGFFGTTFGGGGKGAGTVFVGQTNGSVSLLQSFAAMQSDTATNAGGASPGGLIALSGGTLYGTTSAGGAAANGTVFMLTTNGSTFSALHDFSVLDSATGTNADGAVPWGGLILSGNKLYGTAAAGGAGGNGVVFSIDTNGGNFTTLHNFAPMDSLTATNTDGAMPLGGLALASNTLYGTTFAGGQGGRGTIFSIQTNGLGFTVLHQFAPVDSVTGTNAEGVSPCATLILSSNVLYGTASAGGAGAAGTVFSIDVNGAQFNVLHSFAAVAGNGTNTDGALPVAPLLRLGNSLYGTTFSAGPGTVGTVFSIPLPTNPAVITNIVWNLNGNVTLYFLGTPGSTNVVQAATSLTPPVMWQNVSTNVADAGGAWQFTDSNTTNARFYRSYVQ
jgi:uncharacterized repeat protein (TIGR03803 family)